MGNDISYHGKKFIEVENGIRLLREVFLKAGNHKWEIILF